MSDSLQLRFRIPEGTQLYEHLRGLSSLAMKQELIVLASNGLRFENQVNQLGITTAVRDRPSQESLEQAQKSMSKPAKDEDSNDGLSLVNVGDELADYIK